MGRKNNRCKKQGLAIPRLPVQPYRPHLPESLLKINEQTCQEGSGKCETPDSQQKTIDFDWENADSQQKTVDVKCETRGCQQETEDYKSETADNQQEPIVDKSEAVVSQQETSIGKCETISTQRETDDGKCDTADSRQKTTGVGDFNSEGSSKPLLANDKNFRKSSVHSSVNETCHEDREKVKGKEGKEKIPSAQNNIVPVIENEVNRACAKNVGKKEQTDGCSHFPSHIKRNIKHLLDDNAKGISVEKFCCSYIKKFGNSLIPSDYGFTDVIDLLNAIPDSVFMTFDGSEGQVLLLPKTGKAGKTVINSSQSRHLPDALITTFQTVLKEHHGGIMLDALIPEYEMRTGKKLEISELGFSSIPDLLSHLTDVFKVFQHDGQQLILCDPTITDLQLLRSFQPWEGSLPDFESRRTLNHEVVARLKMLVEEEFRGGLNIDELLGAYRGFFGATLEDLNHESYGYRTLEALLRAHPEVVSVQYREGAVMVLANHPPFPLLSDETHPSWPLNVAEVGDSYQRLDVCTLMPVDKMVDVVIGEVYTPHRFWVIHRGHHTSQSLNALMDCMFEFYSSRLGDRYLVPQERIAIGAPVVALYAEDMNFYRAIITSLEDLRTVKLFFVDYGTVCQCDSASLRLIHKRFFILPAQAIKAALSGVIPPEGRMLWSRATSQTFLQMIQNKGLVAHIVLSKVTTHMSLWDTTGEEDISIGEVLIAQGLANPSCLPPLDELEQRGSSCDSSVVLKQFSSPEKQVIESISPVVNSKNLAVNTDNPHRMNAESLSLPLILDSMAQTIHPMRAVGQEVTESQFDFFRPQSVTGPLKMADRNTYNQSSLSDSCNDHMINTNSVDERNKSHLNAPHEFIPVTTASGLEAGNMHLPVSHSLSFELEALRQRLYEDYNLVNAALKQIESCNKEQSSYLHLTQPTSLNFSPAVSSLLNPVVTVSALSAVDNKQDLDRSSPQLAALISNKVTSYHSNRVENVSEVSGDLEVQERFSLCQNQRATQDLELMSKNVTQVTDAVGICSMAPPGFTPLPKDIHAIGSPPGSGPSPKNLKYLKPPPGFPENLQTLDPLLRFRIINSVFQTINASPRSDSLSATPQMINPPQFGSSPMNYQVTDPPPGLGSLLNNHQATTSSGFLTNMTPVLAPPIMCTGSKDELFYSDEEDEVTVQCCISPKKHHHYHCVIKSAVLTASNTLHIIVLDGMPFVLSAEISCMLWHADVLQSLLHQKGINIPKIDIKKGTDANVIIQLIESGVNAVYGDNGKILPSLTAYPLKTLPQILQTFACDDSVLLSAVKNLIYEYGRDDSVEVHTDIDANEENSPTSKIHRCTSEIPSKISYCKVENTPNPSMLDEKVYKNSILSEGELLVKKHGLETKTLELNENYSQCIMSSGIVEPDNDPSIMNDEVCSTIKNEAFEKYVLQKQESEQPTQLHKLSVGSKSLSTPHLEHKIDTSSKPLSTPPLEHKIDTSFKHLSTPPLELKIDTSSKHLSTPPLELKVDTSSKPLSTSPLELKIDTSYKSLSTQPLELMIDTSSKPLSTPPRELKIDTSSKPLLIPFLELKLDTSSKPLSPPPMELKIDTSCKPLSTSPLELKIDTSSKPLSTPPLELNIDTSSKPLSTPPLELKIDTSSKPLSTPPLELKIDTSLKPLSTPPLELKIDANEENSQTSKIRHCTPEILCNMSYCKAENPPIPLVLVEKLNNCSSMSKNEILDKKHSTEVEALKVNENSQKYKFSSSSEKPDYDPIVANDKVCFTTRKEAFGKYVLQEQGSEQPTQLTKLPKGSKPLSKPPLEPKPLTKPPLEPKSLTKPPLEPKPLTKPPLKPKPLTKPPLKPKPLTKLPLKPMPLTKLPLEPKPSTKPYPGPSQYPKPLTKPLCDSRQLTKPQDHDPSTKLSRSPKLLTTSLHDPKALIRPSLAHEQLAKQTFDHKTKPYYLESLMKPNDPEPLVEHPCDPKVLTKPLIISKSLTRSHRDTKSMAKSSIAPDESLVKPSHDPKPLAKLPHDSKTNNRPLVSESLIKPSHDSNLLVTPLCDHEPLPRPLLKPKPLAKLHKTLAHSPHEPILLNRPGYESVLRPPQHPEPLTKPTCGPQPLTKHPCDPKPVSGHPYNSKLLTKPSCDNRSLADAYDHKPLIKPPLSPKLVTKLPHDLQSITKPFQDPEQLIRLPHNPKSLTEQFQDRLSLTKPYDDPKSKIRSFDLKPLTDLPLHDPIPLNKSRDSKPLDEPLDNPNSLTKPHDELKLVTKPFDHKTLTASHLHDPKLLNKPPHDPTPLNKLPDNLKQLNKPHNPKPLSKSPHDPMQLTRLSFDFKLLTTDFSHDSKPLIPLVDDCKSLNRPSFDPKPLSNLPHNPEQLTKPPCDSKQLSNQQHDPKPLTKSMCYLKPLNKLHHHEPFTDPFHDSEPLANPSYDSQPLTQPPCSCNEMTKPSYYRKPCIRPQQSKTFIKLPQPFNSFTESLADTHRIATEVPHNIELLRLEIRILKGILAFKRMLVELLRTKASDGENKYKNQLTDQINQIYGRIIEKEKKFKNKTESLEL